MHFVLQLLPARFQLRAIDGLALLFLIVCTSACQVGHKTPAASTQASTTKTAPTSAPTVIISKNNQTPTFDNDNLKLTIASTASTAPPPSPTLTPGLTTSVTPSDTADLTLKDQVESITSSGGKWHIIFKEVNGDTIFAIHPQERITIASVFKVPLAVLFFNSLADRGISDLDLSAYIQTTGTGGRTYDQLLQAMLVKSEERATTFLYEEIQQSYNYHRQIQQWDIGNLDLESRRFTASGVAEFYEKFYLGKLSTRTSRNLILDYLSEYTPNDDGRIGSINPYIPDQWQVFNKRGSLLTPYVVADTAIIENPDGPDYILVIFSYNSVPKTTYEHLDEAVAEIALAVWDYIEQTSTIK